MDEWPINITEAAERLGIPKSTASVLITGAEIPARRIGQTRVIDKAGFALLKLAASRLPGRAPTRRKATASSA